MNHEIETSYLQNFGECGSTKTETFSALTWCRRQKKKTKRQKNEEYEENRRLMRWCSIVPYSVSSTPRRSHFILPKATYI